mgnify:CR=1 FL=1
MDRGVVVTHAKGEDMSEDKASVASYFFGPDGLDQFNALCKRYAGLALIMIGYLQVLTDHERGYLGKLAAYLLQ